MTKRTSFSIQSMKCILFKQKKIIPKLLLYIFSCAVLFCSIIENVSAQSIEISDLLEQSHPIYPEAEAKYIINNKSVTFQFTRGKKPGALYKVHQRIKIYNETAVKRGEFELLMINGYADEVIYDIKAVVFSINQDGSIREDKLKEQNIYEVKEDNYSYKKFALPNVRAGCIIDIQYNMISHNIYTIQRHFFQHDIPVKESILKVELPSRLAYNPIFTGEHPFNTSRKTNLLNKPNAVLFTMTAVDIPPIIEDEYVINIDDFRTSLKYELQTFYYANGRREDFGKSWESLAVEMHNHADFGKQLRKKIKPLKHILNEAKSYAGSAKIKYLYDYIRLNFKWNEKYGIFTDLGIKKCIKNGKGNIADINLLLTNLLIRSGINASPIIMKSRWRGILNPKYPSLTEPNYVVVKVEIEGKIIILDATHKNIPFGQLPLRSINSVGVSMYDKKAEIVVMENPHVYTSHNLYDLSFDTSETRLTGINSGKLSNYAATNARLESKEETKDLQGFKENDKDIFSSIIITNMNNIYSDITYEQEVELSSTVDKIEGNLILGAFIKNLNTENQFTTQKRKYPVFFNYKYAIKNIIKLKIPEGYILESKPDDISVSLPSKGAVFHYKIYQFANSLIVNCFIEQDKIEFSSYEYPQLRAFMKKIISKQAEKIILVKE
jgi:hypothetical protein